LGPWSQAVFSANFGERPTTSRFLRVRPLIDSRRSRWHGNGEPWPRVSSIPWHLGRPRCQHSYKNKPPTDSIGHGSCRSGCLGFMRSHGHSRPRNRLIRMAGLRSVLGANMPGSLATLAPRHIALQPALDPACCLSHDDSIHWYNSHLGSLEIGAEQATRRRSRPFDRNRDGDGLQESRGGGARSRRERSPWTPQRMGRLEGQGGVAEDRPGHVSTPRIRSPRLVRNARRKFRTCPLTWLKPSVHDSKELCDQAM
jgi:hypothetical protein